MTKEKGQKDKEKLASSFSLSFCLFSFVIVLFFVLLFTASDYLFGIFKLLFVLLHLDRQYNDKRKRAKGQREA
jgi:hypothetical protein